MTSAKIVFWGAIIILLGFVGIKSFTQQPKIQEKREWTTVMVNDSLLNTEVVRTDEAKRQGLSGRVSLGEHEAMLFIYDRPRTIGMWMKDMHFPLDMIWLDSRFKVIHMVSNVQPESYPNSFWSPLPAQYVLELSAGMIEKYALGVGDYLTFGLK